MINSLKLCVGLVISTILFASCLKDPGNYTCPNITRTHLTLDIDNESIRPDDYASGAVVYMKEGDTATHTIVEMSLYKDKMPYVFFIQMDTTVFEGYKFTQDSVVNSYISINTEKHTIVMDTVYFTQLSGSVSSNYANLFYYDNGRGNFSGKFLKPGQTDSTIIKGTFCYDDAIED